MLVKRPVKINRFPHGQYPLYLLINIIPALLESEGDTAKE